MVGGLATALADIVTALTGKYDPTNVPTALARVAADPTSWAWTEGFNLSATISGTTELAFPTGIVEGETRTFWIVGNSGTSRTLNFNSSFGGSIDSVTVTSTNGALVTMHAVSSSKVLISVAMEVP